MADFTAATRSPGFRAAAAGLAGATDVTGGYTAWQAAGLPTAHPAERTVAIAPGASPAYWPF